MTPISSLDQFWRLRSPRERAILAAGAVAASIVLLYAALWEPGLAGRKRLSAALPLMRAQVEEMRSQQSEIRLLRKEKAAAGQAGDLNAVFRAVAARSAVGRSFGRVELLSPRRLQASSQEVAFDAWLLWLAELQREYGIRLESCRVVPLERRGMVRVDAVFVRPDDAP
jgi:type II secretory pathway component PulM